jgi:LuxR family quorum sensing-dependent transcriptional regulator
MRRPSLDQTIEFVKSLDAARTQEEICARVLAVTRDFGVEHILAGTIPQRGALSQTQKSNILLDRWPRDWAIRYFSRNYIFSDPAIRKLPDGRAFRWSELDAMTRDNPRARLVMNEATEFGLRSGITIPLLPIENEVIGFSLAGRHLEMGPHEESMLLMLASYATGRALVLRDNEREMPAPFTVKEKDVLRYVASGLARSEIAQRMNVTDKAVDWHLRNIRDKMGVSTTTFAVAEAIRLGIIV